LNTDHAVFPQKKTTITCGRIPYFAKVKNSKNLPVFLTSYEVYEAVMKESEKLYPAAAFYNLQTEVPIPAAKNLPGRPFYLSFIFLSNSCKFCTS
jgi:hypothetical protein